MQGRQNDVCIRRAEQKVAVAFAIVLIPRVLREGVMYMSVLESAIGIIVVVVYLALVFIFVGI